MAQVTFASDSTPSLVDLDANHTQLYDLRELVSTPGYAAATPRLTYSATTGWTVSGLGASGYNTFQATNNSSVTLSVGVSGSTAAGWSQGLAHIGTSTNNNLNFGTNGTWRGQWDTSGNLLIGTTSTTPNPGVALVGTGGISIGNTAQASGWGFLYFLRSGVSVGSITQSGTAAVLYNTTSDERLKTNIVDAPESGQVIDAMRVRSHGWKGSDLVTTYGFVAQELHPIAPQAVHVGDGGDEVENAWGVDYSKLVPLLVKEVQSLRLRVTQLEA